MKVRGTYVEGGSEFKTECPSCGHEKLFINVRKMVGHCMYCKKNLYREDIKNLGVEETSYEFIKQVGGLGAAAVQLSDPDAEALAYLAGRNIRYEDHKSDIRYQPDTKRLYFRVWHVGACRAPSWHTRSIEPGKGWVVYPGTKKAEYLFGSGGGPTLVIVEGIFDALSLQDRHLPAVALLGTAMSLAHFNGLMQWRACGLKQITVWLDPDDAGRAASEKICTQLEPFFNVIEVLGYPEPSESEEIPDALFSEFGFTRL